MANYIRPMLLLATVMTTVATVNLAIGSGISKTELEATAPRTGLELAKVQFTLGDLGIGGKGAAGSYECNIFDITCQHGRPSDRNPAFFAEF